MIRSHKYLESAMVEELAAQYESQGFDVSVAPTGDESVFDLLVKKGTQMIAFVVVARGTVKEAGVAAVAARRVAQAKGYEFRVVIVVPPHAADIDVEGLEDELESYLHNNAPANLWELPPHFGGVEEVFDLEFDSVALTKNGAEIEGSGLVRVILGHDPGDRDDSTFRESFPFRFRVLLNADLSIKEINELTVDTSSYWGE